MGLNFSSTKKGVKFTCGRDVFRISMTIDLDVWSSIAGYGSRKRCWLGDQKCGQFRMVVRARISSFLPSIFSLSRDIQQNHCSCSFHFIPTVLSVALEVGYIGITKGVVFLRWAKCEAHVFGKYRGTLDVQVFTGGGWRRVWWQEHRPSFGGLVGWNERVWTGRTCRASSVPFVETIACIAL